MSTRNIIEIPAEKYLDPVKNILSEHGVTIRGTRLNPPAIAVGEVSEAVRGALSAVGCEVREGELFEFNEIEFSEKMEHSMALTLASMSPQYRGQRLLNVIVRTTLPKGSEDELEPYSYEHYPGFASTFIMQVSAEEAEELVEQDWVESIRMPVSFDLSNNPAWAK